MLINYATQNSAQRYNLMAQTIIPRPIAWIVTEDKEGIINIAPFSYFTALSSQPPTLIVSIGYRSDGTPKDTLQNIRKSHKCTICMVEESDLEEMHFSSKALPHHQSEAVYFNIPTKRILEDFPPIVKNTPSAFFCTLYQEIGLKESKTIPLILEIKQQLLTQNIVKTEEKERVNISFKPVARIGKKYAFLANEIEPPKIP